MGGGGGRGGEVGTVILLQTLFLAAFFHLLTEGAERIGCSWSHSVAHTHTHTQSVALLWTSDQPVAETST